ncbi:glycoside hydrolase family 3 N-terminal domain-containing protein [Thermodesulfovibrio sp. TK110]
MNNLMNLVIARLDGDKINDSQYRHYIEKLVKDGIGGFVVFGGDYEEIKNFIAHLQSMALKPLIVASDIERGVGQQIKGGKLIPSQMGIAAGFDLTKDKAWLEALYSIVIKEALDVGINLALIPVMDVNTEPDNPIICTRAFSDNSEVVSKYGSFSIKFFESHGLLTCAKHFPGHGATQTDSHLALPYIGDNIETHLKPFEEAIKAKVSSIMVGHIVAFDTKPASLSEKTINELLKQKLGFKGAVITDAMNMKALMEYKNPHVLAFIAGADIILHPQDPYAAWEEIKTAYKQGVITDIRIKDAQRRISRLRKKIKRKLPIGVPKKSTIRVPQKVFDFLGTPFGGAPIVNDENISLIHRAFKKTVTVIKNEIDSLNSRQIIPYLVGTYTEEIKKTFQSYFGFAFDLKDYKPSNAIPLIAAFTNIKAAGREYLLKENQNTMIRKIISNNETVVVSFGNPYVLRPFKKAKAIIAVYDSHELAVLAFLDAFSEGFKTSGGRPTSPQKVYDFLGCSSGRLPVKIEWIDE